MLLRHRASVLFLLTTLLAGTGAIAAEQTAEQGPLTLERIMAHPDWIGNTPERPYWGDDGKTVFYERKRQGEDRRDLVRVDAATGASTLVADADRGQVDVGGGELSLDRKWKVYARRGDVYLKDLTSGAVRQITRTVEEEANPYFLVDGNRVAFRRGDNVFLYDRLSGLTSQAADIRLGKDPAEKGEPGFLEAQQSRLFDLVRERQEKEKRRREQEEAEQKADPTRPPLPFYLGDGIAILEASLSPAGDWLLLVTSPKPDKAALKPSKVPVWVNESGNVDVEEARPKVGTETPVPHSLILLDLKNRKRHDLDLAVLPGIKDDPLKDLRKAAAARKAAEKNKDAKNAKESGKEKEDEEPKQRPVEVTGFAWTDDGSGLAIQLRARDNKDRWIATADFAGGKLVSRHRLTDKGWINWGFNDFGWLRDNSTLWYLSEETGWSHLYLQPAGAGRPRALTSGRYEVFEPEEDRAGRYLYYTANQGHPGIFETWRVEVATGKSEQLTRLGGLSASLLSPDESRLLVLHSEITRPNELYLQDNRPEAEARQLTNTRSPEFLAVDWTLPEIIPIPSTHGSKIPVYSRVYTPPGFDPSKKYPAVVFTHGAGYLQNVHYGWSTYFREFMFHTLLTRNGYVVLDMDYRASSGYGRDWRTAIYRQMGHPEVEDLEDGVDWLVKNRGVDRARVGTYGGSYGGFLTFMSMFREPDLFAAGAALRPVTDWAHYDNEYTSNILNTPEVDPEAFTKSSPIEFAAGLRKPLLICTGMMDDNVFFQDSVRLVQRLIELKKENFETAIYPVERHAFTEPASWLDEYRRIFKLFETHLK